MRDKASAIVFLYFWFMSFGFKMHGSLWYALGNAIILSFDEALMNDTYVVVYSATQNTTVRSELVSGTKHAPTCKYATSRLLQASFVLCSKSDTVPDRQHALPISCKTSQTSPLHASAYRNLPRLANIVNVPLDAMYFIEIKSEQSVQLFTIVTVVCNTLRCWCHLQARNTHRFTVGQRERYQNFAREMWI